MTDSMSILATIARDQGAKREERAAAQNEIVLELIRQHQPAGHAELVKHAVTLFGGASLMPFTAARRIVDRACQRLRKAGKVQARRRLWSAVEGGSAGAS